MPDSPTFSHPDSFEDQATAGPSYGDNADVIHRVDYSKTHVMNGKNYEAFLVRLVASSPLTYVCFDGGTEAPRFVSRPEEATHFARRIDAQQMVNDIPDFSEKAVVSLHRWVGGIPVIG